MLVLDSPNKEDASKRRPLSGRAGKELDRFFDDFHIPARSKWFVTFLFKSLIDDKKPSSAEEVAEHAGWLLDEIRETRPRVIVVMGKKSLAWLLGDAHDSSDWHGLATGIPVTHPAYLITPNAVVFPAISPGHAFISPSFFRMFAQDMARLELLLKGQLPAQPVDDGVGEYKLLHGDAVRDLLA
jgi:uracil-DNA glycosylase family 4